jgi:hypothetical protein
LKKNTYPVLALLMLLWPLLNAHAFSDSALSLGTLHGQGWGLQGVELQLQDFDGLQARAELRIATLAVDVLPAPLKQLRLHCGTLRISSQSLRCNEGILESSLPLLKQVKAQFTYAYQGDFSVRLDSPRFSLNWNMDARGWHLNLNTRAMPLADLQRLSAYFGAWLTDWQFDGQATLNLKMSSAGLLQTELKGSLENFSYANEAGTQAGENLHLALNIQPGLKLDVQLKNGAIYSDPIYFNHQGHAVRVQGDLHWHDGHLRLQEFTYQHPGVLSVGGTLEINDGTLTLLRLRSEETLLNPLYRVYLSHYFEEKQWIALNLGGTAQLDLNWGKDQRALSLKLAHLTLARGEVGKELLVNGINGALHWRSDKNVADSHLEWKGARLAPLNLGPGKLRLRLHGADITLLEPLKLAILDGSLNIEQFAMQEMFSDNPQVLFTGEVEPISMQAVSHAFAWPELGGEISGRIPGLHYADKHLQIDAALVIKVFGGNVVAHNLGVRDLLGQRPQLHGDILLNDLDLDLLTGFFSFGAITGRLSGQIEDLQMINWKPVAFDAFFQSSGSDKSTRKISQKAINNLSSLGGAGVTQALSRSVLRLFEEFNYSKLGWGCRLRHGRCAMRGVEPTAAGYYIVKGGLLPPRIDVIGYNQDVDWNDLLHRLQSITAVGTPVIK